MKKVVFVSVLISFLIFSCNQKEKYQGKWSSHHFHNSNVDDYVPDYLQIINDSIKFNYGVFNHWHNYKLEINGNRFLFNGNEMDVLIEVDTLVLAQKYYFVNRIDDSLEIYEHETPILDIELPKLERISKLDIDKTSPNFYIYFGKRLDNDEYSLQLNDKYANIYDLRAFTNNGSCSGSRDELISFPTIYLFIDGTTSLSYIDQIFNELIMSAMLKVGFINNINLIQNDTEFKYDFEILTKKLPSFHYESKYISQLNKSELNQPPSIQPPPPPPYNVEKSKTNYVFLIKSEMFYNNERIDQNQLSEIIEKSIKSNHSIFTLYDLESNYSSFLEMNAIVDNTYEDIREQKSKSKYNKSLKSLSQDELRDIMVNEVRHKHYWSFSIPHYQALVKTKNIMFSGELKSIDSLLPTAVHLNE